MAGNAIFTPLNRFVVGLLCLVALTFLLSVRAEAAGLVEGLRKYEAGDYAGAIGEWQPLADRGNPDALFNMGQVYRLGRGVARDAVRATGYYEAAAGAGHAGARGALATIYYFDHGTRQKRGQAIALWRLAAAAGDAPSQYTLAILHFNGRDVTEDPLQAYAWALLAAEGGLAEGKKAERSIRAQLTPNQLAQAQVLKEALLVPGEVLPPGGMTPPSAGDNMAKTAMAASPEPAPPPAAEPASDPIPPASDPIPEDGPAPEEEAAAEIPAGNWSVQLGFYRSRTNARRYWDKVAPRVGELVPGAASVIVTVDTGAERGVFYRLLAGAFAARPEADYLCDNLKAIDIDCVVWTGR